MPNISHKRACRNRRCGELVIGGGYCVICAPKFRRVADERANATRPGSTALGYGYSWQRAADYQRRKEPLCRMCRAQGRLTPAECVDHILPKSRGGTDAPENLQSLCWSCHSRKTRQE